MPKVHALDHFHHNGIPFTPKNTDGYEVNDTEAKFLSEKGLVKIAKTAPKKAKEADEVDGDTADKKTTTEKVTVTSKSITPPENKGGKSAKKK